jgi:hypothetical protein
MAKKSVEEIVKFENLDGWDIFMFAGFPPYEP